MTNAQSRSHLWAPRASATAVFLANGVGIGAWSVAIPRFGAGFSLSNGKLSWMLLAFAAGALIAMPLTGYVATKARTRTSTVVAGLGFATSLALLVLASSFPLVLFLAFVLGAGNGAMDVSMNAHAVELERRWGRPIMSSLHAAFSIGGALGAGIGVRLGAASSDAGLWGPAALELMLVGVAALFLMSGNRAPTFPTLRIPNGVVMGVCLLALLCMMMEGAVVDWSATLLLQSGIQSQRISTAYVAFSSCMVVGRLMGGKATSLVSGAQILCFGGLLAALGFVVALSFSGLFQFAIGFALIGLGLSNIIPILFSAAGRLESPSVGVAMAATAGYSGFLLGPVVIGALAAMSNLHLALMILIAPALIITATTFTGRLRKSL